MSLHSFFLENTMKNIYKLLAVLLAITASPAAAQTFNGPCYRTSDTWTLASGCTLTSASGSTVTLAGTTTLSGTTNLSNDVTLATGKALHPDTTTAHTMLLQAYDVDGTAYKTFGTFTNGNTPSYALAQPSGGTLTWDGGAIGATTAAAGTFTTLQANTSLKVNATDGTSITAIRFASDAIASGQTAKTTSLTGVTASSKCVATGNEVPSNTAYIKSAAAGTDQVIVTVNTDPGASNLDFTLICLN